VICKIRRRGENAEKDVSPAADTAQTDALFYKLFRLVLLRPKGKYAFESITVKTTEKRFDGFLKRTVLRDPAILRRMNRHRYALQRDESK
jgi:hypothetical protein